jgi:hypothetical protein
MVGLSGEDSWALFQILTNLRKRALFSLIGVTVDSG